MDRLNFQRKFACLSMPRFLWWCPASKQPRFFISAARTLFTGRMHPTSIWRWSRNRRLPDYDDRLFSPAAPVARVTLRNPQSGRTQSEIPMLIDSGADVTLLATLAIQALGIESSGSSFQMEGFDWRTSVSEAVQAD